MTTKKQKESKRNTAQNKIKVVNAEVIFANLTDEGLARH